MRAVVPAAGRGSRLASYDTPKPMIRIGELPMLFHLFGELGRAGVTDICVIQDSDQNLEQMVADSLGRQLEGSSRGQDAFFQFASGLEVRFVDGHHEQAVWSLMSAKDFVGTDRFIVALPDELIREGFRELATMCIVAKELNAPVCGFRGSSQAKIVDLDGELVSSHEAGAANSIPENGASIVGRFVLPPDIFDSVEDAEDRDFISLLSTFCSERPLVGVRVDGPYWNVNTPRDALLASKDMKTWGV